MNTRLPESFHPFFDSLTFTPPSSDAHPVAILRKDTPSVMADGREFISNRISLYQHEATQVSIVGFRQKLLHILREAKHVATESVADAILGCVVKAASSGKDRATFLEDFLTGFRTVEVSHFYVLPNMACTEPLRIEGYTIGALNVPVLASRCNRAHSDFAQLYSSKLAGHVTLQSPEFRHVVLDFVKVHMERGRSSERVWLNLLLNYFERTSRLHFDFMWSHLERTQVLAAPFGAEILDVQNLRVEIGEFAQRVTIYLGFSREEIGYVVPEGGALTLNQPGPDSEAFKRFTDHRASYRVSEIGDSELGRTLFACAGFCQEAIRFLRSDRPDDAALYATICLEHLFSEKQSTADAVCSRAAVLTHPRLADDFAHAEKEMRKLYDARSAFVHSGQSITPTQAERLIAYARETLRSMLVLHLKPENRCAGFLEKWVRDLDFIVAGIAAGKTIDPASLAECGILHP